MALICRESVVVLLSMYIRLSLENSDRDWDIPELSQEYGVTKTLFITEIGKTVTQKSGPLLMHVSDNIGLIVIACFLYLKHL